MRDRTHLLRLALIATALAFTACGDPTDSGGPSTAQRTPHWQAHGGEDANVQVVRPDARLGVPDPDGGPPRLIVNVLASCDVVLKGHAWLLSSEDEAVRRESRGGLRAQLAELTARAKETGPGDGPALPVQFHADREAPWRAIRAVLSILREAEIGTTQLQWAVRVSGAPDMAERVDGTLGTEEASPGKPLAIRIVPDRKASWTAVRIFSPAGIHSFGPQASRFAEEAFLRKANATWIDLERALPALAETHTTAHVEVRDAEADVWFAYVVKTVDLLFGAGFEQVRLPQEGIVLMRPGDDG